MLVLHAAICTNAFKNTEIRFHRLASIFAASSSLALVDRTKNFSVLVKCMNKFDCLLYEMFFIQELRPALNVKLNSIRAKVIK